MILRFKTFVLLSMSLILLMSFSMPSKAVSLPKEMQMLSKEAYSTKNENSNGWVYYTSYSDKSSLTFKVYRKKVSANKYNYAFAYKGSKETLDFFVDYYEIAGSIKGIQVSNALNATKKIINNNLSNINKVYFTGHSLGGYIASWIESEFVDHKLQISKSRTAAYVFNNPGISPSALINGLLLINPVLKVLNKEAKNKILSDKRNAYDKYIINYHMKWDMVSTFGDNLGKVKKFNNTSKNNNHSIKSFDNIYNY